MRNSFVYGVGGVLSADIAVPEHQREVDFYASILCTGDAPLWRDDLRNNCGTAIIGLGERTPEYENLPLQWMPHVQVADVAVSVKQAKDMGGQVLMQGTNDEGESQWAVLTDPDGAAFGVIPVVVCESPTAQQNARQGGISWLSLMSPNPGLTQDFYQKVVGWRARPIKETGVVIRYEMLIDDAHAVAEIKQFAGAPSDTPSVWLIHLPVDNLIESLQRVRTGGGQIINQLAEENHALIRDPIGVYLALQAGD